MTSPAITVRPIWTVAGAAALMLDKRVNRLPVVKAGQARRIVTRADSFARSLGLDEAIRVELREAVDFHQGLMLLDESPVEVAAHGGEAVLTGKVRRRSQAEILPKVAEAVPGVVAVRSALDWSEDDAVGPRCPALAIASSSPVPASPGSRRSSPCTVRR